jgi:alpha-galactosidase
MAITKHHWNLEAAATLFPCKNNCCMSGPVKMVFLLLFFIFPAFAGAKIVGFPYGKNNVIHYDLSSGTMTISGVKGTRLFKLEARAIVNGGLISSTDYTHRHVVKTALRDKFGSGNKYVVTLTGKGLPLMKQLFYTYPGKEYFLTEIEFSGSRLSSNYMAPVSGSFVPVKGDCRSLFVPFDNDTFISYNSRPFAYGASDTSAEVGAVYDNKSRLGLVSGSVEHGTWKTGVMTAFHHQDRCELEVWGGYADQKINRDNIPHGKISGNTVKSPKIFLGIFKDWRKGLEEFGSANRMADPPYLFNWTKSTPVGWNSWGVLKNKLSYESAVKVAGFFADSLPHFRTGGTAYIDLDSYWDNFVRGGDYSQLKKFADYCKSKGLKPGIYWAPFTDWGSKTDGTRKVQGSNYTYADIWTKTGGSYHDLDGGRALDPTHPGTKQRIAYYLGKFRKCGFEMIKIDFLGHAAIESDRFYDPKVTTGMQAFRQGMEYVDDQLDGKMLVYAAISPNLATGRYVHVRRIACDAFKSIADTRYTLNSVNYGWWLSKLYNFVDADHVVLSDKPPGTNRARLLSAVITGTLITGDDFSTPGQWSSRAIAMFQNQELLEVVKNRKAFRPVEGDTADSTSAMFTTRIGKAFYLAIFNFSSQAKKYQLADPRIGLPFAAVIFRDVLGKKDLPAGFAMTLDGEDAILLKISN